MTNTLNPSYVRAKIDQWPSNENYKRFFPSFVLISEGLVYLMDAVDSKGFLDMVGNYQLKMRREQIWHQHWTIKKELEHKRYKIMCYDIQDDRLIINDYIPFVDMNFPWDDLTIHVGVMDEHGQTFAMCLLSEED